MQSQQVRTHLHFPGRTISVGTPCLFAAAAGKSREPSFPEIKHAFCIMGDVVTLYAEQKVQLSYFFPCQCGSAGHENYI